MASSLQGKGTLVRKEPGEINMEKTEIQEGMRLFQDSMELLEATIRPISVYTLKAAGGRKRERLAERWRGWSEKKLVMYVLRRICRL